MVAGRSSARKSSAIDWLTSGAAQVASVTVPAATAAFRYSDTSGVESSQRFAYSAASYLLPWHIISAQAERMKALPIGTFGLTVMRGTVPTRRGLGAGVAVGHGRGLGHLHALEFAPALQIGIEAADVQGQPVVFGGLVVGEGLTVVGGGLHDVGQARHGGGAFVLEVLDVFGGGHFSHGSSRRKGPRRRAGWGQTRPDTERRNS